MKTNLAEKSSEYDKLKEKHSQEESKLGKLVDELLVLKKTIANLESENKKLQSDQLLLNKNLRQEMEDKIQKIKQFESKVEEMQRQNESDLQQVKDETSKQLMEKQVTLTQKESDLNQLQAQLKALREDFARAEAAHLHSSQQHLQRQAELELKMMELAEKNRALAGSANRQNQLGNSTVRERHAADGSFSCPLCGGTFRNMADLQVHVEGCVS